MTSPRSILRSCLSAFVPVLALAISPTEASADTSFTAFESGQVRPLALSPSGKLLFAVNTPDNRLEIFKVAPNGLEHRASVTVGLEPVAVAARSDGEVWVVNHLSDSVSVVEVEAHGHVAHVSRTLLVGDEPRDIVFAGPGKGKAFVTTAHRGQNSPIDPQLTTPGVGRADVWVLNANTKSATPLTIVTLFADTPRALAVSPDGGKVYAAGFHTGNRTTSIHESAVNGSVFATVDLGGRVLPGPFENHEGIPAPAVGLILKHDGAHWVDENGTVWDDMVRFDLPDKDVFVIDANASPPVEVGSAYTGVGTVLFNMAVNPVSGRVYVSNTEALNDTRFEGPGVFAGRTLRGHFAESRITVLGPQGSVAPRHLNKHVDYSQCCAPAPNAESALSLAMPTGMAVSPDGEELYVAALGSSKIGVFQTAALEDDTFQPSAASQIQVTGGGPTGMVLHAQKKRLYVLTRFDNSISIVDTQAGAEVGHVPMYNPEPASLVQGRRFLYDATLSSHGDSSCASCHIFGDMDDLAWDLGNPDEDVQLNPGPFGPPGSGLVDPVTGFPVNPLSGVINPPTFHPLKGPMTTQSLRGMANHGPMHWRGDRNGGSEEPSAQPDDGAFDERAAFIKFRGAFAGLLGGSQALPTSDMEAFTDFILQVTYPPNPIRALDNSLTPDQAAGKDIFMNIDLGGGIGLTNVTCESCHTMDPEQNIGSEAAGFFGTSGLSAFILAPQVFKIPHLRNLYQKVGMFGMAPTWNFVPGNNDPTGDQIRGFGFAHDGSVDTVFRFDSTILFTTQVSPNGFLPGPAGDLAKHQVEQFLLAMDSNMAPIVGQQITARKGNIASVAPRVQLLRDRAEEGECDLVAKTRIADREVGFLYLQNGTFVMDVDAIPPLPPAILAALAAVRPVTFTCAPPGSGVRVGIDRDLDGAHDGDEILAGSDPSDPTDTP